LHLVSGGAAVHRCEDRIVLIAASAAEVTPSPRTGFPQRLSSCRQPSQRRRRRVSRKGTTSVVPFQSKFKLTQYAPVWGWGATFRPGGALRLRSARAPLCHHTDLGGRQRKSINLLDIIGNLLYILDRSLLARTAIRLVVRAPLFPDSHS